MRFCLADFHQFSPAGAGHVHTCHPGDAPLLGRVVSSYTLESDTVADRLPMARRGQDRSRQLLRRDLSAVLRLDAGGGREATPCRRCTRRRWPACRSGCTCTSRSAASGATSATSASTPTRTRRRSRTTSTSLAREWELYAKLPAIAGRPLNFVYFGGGTPSFLSTRQLEGLVVAADGARRPGTRPRRSRSSASRAR